MYICLISLISCSQLNLSWQYIIGAVRMRAITVVWLYRYNVLRKPDVVICLNALFFWIPSLWYFKLLYYSDEWTQKLLNVISTILYSATPLLHDKRHHYANSATGIPQLYHWLRNTITLVVHFQPRAIEHLLGYWLKQLWIS